MVLIPMKTVAILTTKKLFPPEDGRADIIRKIVEMFDDDPHYTVIVVSLVPQPPTPVPSFTLLTVESRISYWSVFVSVIRGLPLQVALFSNPGISRAIREQLRGAAVDIVVADMTRTAMIALRIPAAKRILDMDDRLSKRYHRQLKEKNSVVHLGKKPEFLPSFIHKVLPFLQKQILWYETKRMRAYESSIVKEFDWTVLVSDKEAKELAEQTGCASVVSIPNYVEFSRHERRTADRPIIIFFGNLASAHNLDGAMYVVKEIFPLIRAEVNEAELWIVGRAIPKEFGSMPASSGIVVYSDVEDVSDYLSQASVCLCPLRYGSGIKTKILEAFAHGIPVVTNWVGAEGIPRADECMYIKDTPAEIARQVVAILDERDGHSEKVKAGYEVLQEYFSKKIVKEKWQSIFG